jgi:cytochrome c oxidase assembly factor CtaG
METVVVVLLVIGLPLVVVFATMWHEERKRRKEYQAWLHDEINAHEKTRHALREAAARMRRENRDKVMGLIEGQRAE